MCAQRGGREMRERRAGVHKGKGKPPARVWHGGQSKSGGHRKDAGSTRGIRKGLENRKRGTEKAATILGVKRFAYTAKTYGRTRYDI